MVYAHSLSGFYLYEDASTAPWSSWREALMALHAPARWLGQFARWGMERAIGGPFADRLLTLLLHALNGGVLWVLARRWLTTLGAGVAVGLFLLAPVQTESVAYIASQPEVLAATCVLLGMLAIDAESLWLAALCVCGAIVSKELAVTAVLLLPLWAWWQGQNWTHPQRSLWLAFGGLLFVGGYSAVLHRGLMALYGGPSVWYTAGQLAQAARLLWLIPQSLLDPTVLTIDHDWNWITKWTAGALTCGWCVALGLAARRRWPWWGFALLWTLASLSVRVMLPLPDGLHERYLYTPLIGVSLAVGALVGLHRPERTAL